MLSQIALTESDHKRRNDASCSPCFILKIKVDIKKLLGRAAGPLLIDVSSHLRAEALKKTRFLHAESLNLRHVSLVCFRTEALTSFSSA